MTALLAMVGLITFLHDCAASGIAGLHSPPVPIIVEPFAEHPIAETTTATATSTDDCSGDCELPASRSPRPHASLCCLTWPPVIARYALANTLRLAPVYPMTPAVAAWMIANAPVARTPHELAPKALPPRFDIVARPVLDRAPPTFA